MNRLRGLFCVIAASILMPACAFVDNEVQLEYQSVAAIPTGGSNAGTIYVSLLEDERADKTKVGVIRNGYGMETAKVLTKDAPAIWVSNTLKGNLERSGYKVETVEKGFSPMPDQFYLSGSLSKVYSDPQMGFWAVTIKGDVQAFMRAQFNEKSTQKLITGWSEETSLFTTGGELHKGVLNKAVSDFVVNVLAWLAKLKT